MTFDLLAVPAVLTGIGGILWIATRLEYLVAPPADPARSVAPNNDGRLAAGLGNTAA